MKGGYMAIQYTRAAAPKKYAAPWITLATRGSGCGQPRRFCSNCSRIVIRNLFRPPIQSEMPSQIAASPRQMDGTPLCALTAITSHNAESTTPAVRPFAVLLIADVHGQSQYFAPPWENSSGLNSS